MRTYDQILTDVLDTIHDDKMYLGLLRLSCTGDLDPKLLIQYIDELCGKRAEEYGLEPVEHIL